MRSTRFGFHNAIKSLSIVAILVIAVVGQGEWRTVPTPVEVTEENKKTGDVTIFERHPDGNERITRTTFFPGTDRPRTVRVVTTNGDSTTISSTNWNEYGEIIASTEDVLAGRISYADSKNDINWQGKQIQGSRWRFRQDEEGHIVGPKIEEYLSPNARTWKRLPGKQPPTVNAGKPGEDRADTGRSRIETVADKRNPQDNDGRGKVVESLARNFANARSSVMRPDYDDNEALRLLKEMESIVAFAEVRISKEESAGPRFTKLRTIKAQAERDIRTLRARLKKSKPADTNSLVGKWRLVINDQQQPGDFKFGHTPDVVNVTRDSKPWITVVDPASNTRIVSLDARAPVPAPFGLQHVQLRGDAASGKLEFWATSDYESTEYQKTQYALVRDDN